MQWRDRQQGWLERRMEDDGEESFGAEDRQLVRIKESAEGHTEEAILLRNEGAGQVSFARTFWTDGSVICRGQRKWCCSKSRHQRKIWMWISTVWSREQSVCEKTSHMKNMLRSDWRWGELRGRHSQILASLRDPGVARDDRQEIMGRSAGGAVSMGICLAMLNEAAQLGIHIHE